MSDATPLLDDPILDDDLPPILTEWHKEYPMPNEPATRTTVATSEARKLCLALGVPIDTDPTKAMRLARERLTQLGMATPLSLEEWMQMGKRFFTNERA